LSDRHALPHTGQRIEAAGITRWLNHIAASQSKKNRDAENRHNEGAIKIIENARSIFSNTIEVDILAFELLRAASSQY
jgi:hypothetical protein